MAELSYTLYDLVDAVRRLAEAKPNFVYERKDYVNYQYMCVYTDPKGCPDCLIGCALADVGDPVPAWDENREYCPDDREFVPLAAAVWQKYFAVTDETLLVCRWVEDVQNRQDAGLPWGDAVAGADHDWPEIALRKSE